MDSQGLQAPSLTVFSRILDLTARDLRGDEVAERLSGRGSGEPAGLTISLQEDQAYDHAQRVHIKLQGALPGNASPVQTQPGACHCHHGESQQLGESHTVGQPSRAGVGTALHAEAAAAGERQQSSGDRHNPQMTRPRTPRHPPDALLSATPHLTLCANVLTSLSQPPPRLPPTF